MHVVSVLQVPTRFGSVSFQSNDVSGEHDSRIGVYSFRSLHAHSYKGAQEDGENAPQR